MPKISKGIITYDSEDWLGGLHPQYTTALTPLQTGGSSFAKMNSINPYRFLGQLTCGRTHTNVTNASTVMTNYIYQGVNNGETAYLIERGSKLHQLTIGTHALLNDTAGVGFPHTISHGAHTGITCEDCVTYNSKISAVSALRYFYSYRDNTDWDVGVHDMNTTTTTFDDDFMSTVPATPLDLTSGYEGGKSFPHPMKVGYDDVLYIGDRNFVHAYDGQAGDNGTFYAQALTLPSEYTITGFAKLSPRSLAIFASTNYNSSSNRSTTTVFFWDYLSLDPYDVKNIPDNLVTAMFEYNGTIGCFAYGRTVYNRLYLYDGSIFKEVKSFGGNPVEYGGVNIVGNEIQWLSGGLIYSYGNQFGLTPTLNAIDQATYTDGTTGSGFYRSFSYTSGDYYSTATKNFQYFTDGSYDGTATPALPYFYTTYTPLGKFKVIKVKVYFSQINATATGMGFTLYLGSYNGTEYEILHELSAITTHNIVTIQNKDTSGNGIPELNGIYLHGIYNGGSGTTTAPIINKIEIYIDPVEFI